MPYSVRRPHAILALALATLAAACGSDSSTAPSSQPVTLDQALTELSTPALSAATASFDVTGAPALPALTASRCAYQAATQSFTCTPIVASGVTTTQSFTLLDGSGAKQSAFDKATTDAVRANTTVAGTLLEGAEQFTIDGQQELTLSGLRTATHTLDGTSTVHITKVGSSPAAVTTVNTTITGLKLQQPTADGTHPWPAAGTIVLEISSSNGGSVFGVIRATLTFTGSSTVNVSLTAAGTSTSCAIDLASSAPSCK
ncbi:MAG TPA: hypothetical protein VF461_05795 [Gemmatimonadaceae bacterium]